MADPNPPISSDPNAPANAPGNPANPAALPPAPRVDGPPIYQGSVSHWMAMKSYVLSMIVLIAGLVLAAFGTFDHFEPIQKLGAHAGQLGTVGVIIGIGLIAVGLIMMFYVMLGVKAHRYTVTSRLIERETGIVVKKVDALDLGRVKHVDMTQSFIERVLNVGTIEVYSGDNVEPELLIEDIPNPRPVYEKLRDAVIDLSRRRGIIVE